MTGVTNASNSKDKKRAHLRKADEISSVFDFKCRVTTTHFSALGKPNGLTYSRLAIMVAKKTHRLAVRRNYMRRVVREFCRRCNHQFQGLDMVVRITKPFPKQEFDAVKQEMDILMSKLVKCRAF